MDENAELIISDLGITDYGETLDLQKQILELRIAGKTSNTVLLTEHNPVITLGARESENKLLADEEQLNRVGIAMYPVRRGGGTTAHNPGQLVVYPIIALRSLNLGINEYIRLLERSGIELLASLGIEADRRKGFPGIWTERGKIASIGVKVSRGTTYHGIAINICNDLGIFDYIVPCGLDGITMVSAKTLGSNGTMADVKITISSILQDLLQ